MAARRRRSLERSIRFSRTVTPVFRMLFMAVLAFFELAPAAALRVDTADGGYTGIVVAIHESVQYQPYIVENIKALFRSASEFLHVATRGRLYFKEVTVVVPRTWPRARRRRALLTGDSLLGTADVRAVDTGSDAGTIFTVQPRGCGQRGHYIQLTPGFLTDSGLSTVQHFGNHVYKLVHEWAHYRYGVYNDHGVPGDDLYPALYCIDNKVVANSGASGKKFTASTKSGDKCTLYKHCQLSEDCIVRFYEEDLIGSSVMFMPHNENASELTRGLKYNCSPPVHTQHYSVCRGKSTREVISSNEDFKILHEPNMEKAIKLAFREVQRSERLNGRIVLVFDVSEEMEVDNRITMIKNAAAFFIRSVVPDGHRLAIVAFAENATIVSELAVIDDSTRRSLVSAVRTLSSTGPSGSVSDGLRKAIEVLGSGNRAETGGMIVLASGVTEGQSYDDISGVVPWLEDNHVAVNTVVFGFGDSTMLSLLRERTRGMSHLVTGFAQETELEVQSGIEASLIEFLAARMDLQKQPIIVLNARKDFEDIIEVNFTLPSGTGKDTRVHILGTSLRTVIASLLNPDNDVCVRCVEAGNDDSSIDLRVPSAAMEGVWKLVLSKSTTHSGNSSNIGVLVTTYQMQPDVEPVRLKLYTAPLDESTAQTIFVDIWKGLQAVLAAEVIATIIGLNASHHPVLKLQLRDDGLEGDSQRNDGTYTGVFSKINGVGRYRVSAEVTTNAESVLAGGVHQHVVYTVNNVPDVSRYSSRGGLVPVIEASKDAFLHVDEDVPKPRRKRNALNGVPVFTRILDGTFFDLTKNSSSGNLETIIVDSMYSTTNETPSGTLSRTSPPRARLNIKRTVSKEGKLRGHSKRPPKNVSVQGSNREHGTVRPLIFSANSSSNPLQFLKLRLDEGNASALEIKDTPMLGEWKFLQVTSGTTAIESTISSFMVPPSSTAVVNTTDRTMAASRSTADVNTTDSAMVAPSSIAVVSTIGSTMVAPSSTAVVNTTDMTMETPTVTAVVNTTGSTMLAPSSTTVVSTIGSTMMAPSTTAVVNTTDMTMETPTVTAVVNTTDMTMETPTVTAVVNTTGSTMLAPSSTIVVNTTDRTMTVPSSTAVVNTTDSAMVAPNSTVVVNTIGSILVTPNSTAVVNTTNRTMAAPRSPDLLNTTIGSTMVTPSSTAAVGTIVSTTVASSSIAAVNITGRTLAASSSTAVVNTTGSTVVSPSSTALGNITAPAGSTAVVNRTSYTTDTSSSTDVVNNTGITTNASNSTAGVSATGNTTVTASSTTNSTTVTMKNSSHVIHQTRIPLDLGDATVKLKPSKVWLAASTLVGMVMSSVYPVRWTVTPHGA